MPTVIDSLVVELGLDPTNFTKQQQAAYDAARKLEQQQLSSAKNVEHSAGRAGEAISGVRTQALEMLAVLTGGAGAVRFATNLTHADAALGRLERNIGVSGKTINAWQGASRIFGGDAQQMAQSFTTLSDAFAGWKIGLVTPIIADLRAISTAGGKVIDINGGVEQSMLDLSENLKRIHDSGPDGPATAGLLGRKVGIDPALYDLMIQGPAKLQAVLDYVRKIGVATKADTDAFGELEKRMGQMGVKADSMARKLLGGERGGATQIIETADFLNLPAGEALTKAGADLKRRYEERGLLGAWWDALTFQGAEKKPEGERGPPSLFSPPIAPAQPTGAFLSQTEKEQFIRAEAAKRGINPNTAMAVAKSEGFNNFISSIPGEKSYGSFQLHVTPGGAKGHLGDQFQKKTGLDPADPKNERATISFALDDVTKNGWAAFHGAKNTGIDRWAGVDRAEAAGPRITNNTTTTEVNINGPITVPAPPGAEPADFAARFAVAVKRQSFVAQANGGQQ